MRLGSSAGSGGGWQLLGVHGAEASEASRSGVNTQKLRADGLAPRRARPALASSSPDAAPRLTSGAHPTQIPFPYFSNQHVGKIDLAPARAGRSQSHRVSHKSFADKALLALPLDLPIASDSPHRPAHRISQLRLTQVPSAWVVNLRRYLLPQCLVGSNLVVRFSPPIRASLLPSEVSRGWACRFGFVYAVHLFVPTILLRMTRLDELHSNPQRRPPRAQPRQSGRPGGTKRAAVVHSDRCRIPTLAKHSQKLPPNGLPALIWEQANAQQITAEQIPDRQGFCPSTVLSSEPALEIDRPYLVASPCNRQRPSLQLRPAARPAAHLPVQAHSLEPAADRPHRWDALRPMLSAQTRRHLPAAPTPVPTTHAPYPRQPLAGDLPRARVRPLGTILESAQTVAFEALQPFVSNPPTVSKLSTQLGHASLGLRSQLHKLQAPYHTRKFFPRHARGKRPRAYENCYPCLCLLCYLCLGTVPLPQKHFYGVGEQTWLEGCNRTISGLDRNI